MNRLWTYLRRRTTRRFALAFLGANEARIVFDFLASGLGVVGGEVYYLLFLPGSSVLRNWRLVLLPPAFVFFNTLFGLYSRLRRGGILLRCAVLLLSLGVCSAALFALGAAPGLIWLSAMLTSGPVLVARVLLSMPHSRHKGLTSLALNQRGPAIVFEGVGYVGSSSGASGGSPPNNREEFDEAEYLELNPDVAHAVAAGTSTSGREHWGKYGRTEGRLATKPKEFDELLYLDLNPDVLQTVLDGECPSGHDHWFCDGKAAGRATSPPRPCLQAGTKHNTCA